MICKKYEPMKSKVCNRKFVGMISRGRDVGFKCVIMSSKDGKEIRFQTG